uniref:Homeobox domain-containing protein n=1 Tax=Glossina palpalis gambiensis TaxID=67801 RepID=A0A1B0BA04_9MUSC
MEEKKIRFSSYITSKADSCMKKKKHNNNIEVRLPLSPIEVYAAILKTSNKRKRTAVINTLTEIQLKELEHEFEKSSYLRAERSILISERLNISVQTVQAWFSQQRECRRNWGNALNPKSFNNLYSGISPHHHNVLNQHQSPYNSSSTVTMPVPLLSIRTNVGNITPRPLNYTSNAHNDAENSGRFPINIDDYVNNHRVNASLPSSIVTNSIPINRTIGNEEILTYEEIVAVIKASPDLCYSDEIVAILDNTVF